MFTYNSIEDATSRVINANSTLRIAYGDEYDRVMEPFINTLKKTSEKRNVPPFFAMDIVINTYRHKFLTGTREHEQEVMMHFESAYFDVMYRQEEKLIKN